MNDWIIGKTFCVLAGLFAVLLMVLTVMSTTFTLPVKALLLMVQGGFAAFQVFLFLNGRWS